MYMYICMHVCTVYTCGMHLRTYVHTNKVYVLTNQVTLYMNGKGYALSFTKLSLLARMYAYPYTYVCTYVATGNDFTVLAVSEGVLFVNSPRV